MFKKKLFSTFKQFTVTKLAIFFITGTLHSVYRYTVFYVDVNFIISYSISQLSIYLSILFQLIAIHLFIYLIPSHSYPSIYLSYSISQLSIYLSILFQLKAIHLFIYLIPSHSYPSIYLSIFKYLCTELKLIQKTTLNIFTGLEEYISTGLEEYIFTGLEEYIIQYNHLPKIIFFLQEFRKVKENFFYL